MKNKTLAQRTLSYWRLSTKWNGRGPGSSKVSTVAALKELGDILDITYYKRPLLLPVETLANEIIRGGQAKAKPTSAPSTVTRMERTNP